MSNVHATVEDAAGSALRTAAIVQLVSGIVNLIFVSWAASLFWLGAGSTVSAVVMAVCTLGLCPAPVGALCGGVGLVIAPIAIVEIISGIAGLTGARPPRWLVLLTAVLELVSVCVANPVAVIAGAVSFGIAVANR
jgi:hypothetical protein